MAGRKKPAQPNAPHGPSVRFVITLGAASRSSSMSAAAKLDLDRLPDADGKVNLLVSADDMSRLLAQGYEVQVMATVPVAPLAEELVMSDRDSKRWLDTLVKGIPNRRGR